MKSSLITSVLGAGLLLGATAVAVPARADTAGEPRGHCVVDLSASGTTCFGTVREAISHATHGQVTDAPLTARAALTDRTLTAKLEGPQSAGQGLAVAYVLSIEYRYPNKDGETITFTGPQPCVEDGQRDYLVNDVRDRDPWWNDRISSFQGYNTCDVNHYEHTVANGGDTTGPRRSMNDMGAMNNRTTGLTWG
ncbi:MULTISPECIES: hypothetical protein [unclassified Streptomyces]|uniref:hypothetical protein n=1 Tax=unclassified Streptomyces TaxID=2593676 RepID=UPI00380A853A